MSVVTRCGPSGVQFLSNGTSFAYLDSNETDTVRVKQGTGGNLGKLRVAAGTEASDAVTYSQLNSAMLSGHVTKQAVFAASAVAFVAGDNVLVNLETGSITVTDGGPTIASLLGEEGDDFDVANISQPAYMQGTRYLFKHSGKVNGIYVIESVTAVDAYVLTRADDYNLGSQVRPNVTVYVQAGEANRARTFGTTCTFARYLENVDMEGYPTEIVRGLASDHAAGTVLIQMDGAYHLPVATASNVYTNSPLSLHEGIAVQIGTFWYTVTEAPDGSSNTFQITPGLLEAAAAATPVRVGTALLGSDDADMGGRIDVASLQWTEVYAGNSGFTIAGTGLVADDITVSMNIGALDSNSSLAVSDVFLVHNGDGHQKVSFETMRDAVFLDVSGHAAISAGGVLAISEGVVENDRLVHSTISGVALGNELYSLVPGTGLSVGVDGFTTSAVRAGVVAEGDGKVFFVASGGGSLKFVSSVESITGIPIVLSDSFAVDDIVPASSFALVVHKREDEGGGWYGITDMVAAVNIGGKMIQLQDTVLDPTGQYVVYVFSGVVELVSEASALVDTESTYNTDMQVHTLNIQNVSVGDIVINEVLQGSGAHGSGALPVLTVATLTHSAYSGAHELTLNLDIAHMDTLGGGELGAADLFIFDDGGTGTNKSCTASQVRAYVLDTPSVTGDMTIETGDMTIETGDMTIETGNLTMTVGDITVSAAGTVTAGTVTADTVSAHTIITLSDLDLKSNVTECGGLDVVEQLRGIQWVWNSDGTPSLGVAAQEVQAVLPQLVFRVNSGLGVNYAGLMGVLINAVNDLSSELNHLKDELRAAVANSI